MNNLGFGSTDGLLYATMLSYDTDGDPSAPYVFSTPDLLGIFKIDSTGKVVGPLVTSGVTIPDNLRWAAGDVHPDGTKMYISTQYQSNTGDGALYIVDLTQNPTERSADGQHAILYAGTRSYLDGVILRLDPQTGTITVVPGSGAIVLPGGVVNNALQAYGGAWFNAVGDLFLYRNEGTVYQIDLDFAYDVGQCTEAGDGGCPKVISTQENGPDSNFNDAAACVAAEIELIKTADPTSVPAGGSSTYTFTVNNLSPVSVTINALIDSIYGDLNSQGNCAVPQNIAAGGSYTCSITEVVPGNPGDVVTNTATASGTDNNGNPRNRHRGRDPHDRGRAASSRAVPRQVSAGQRGRGRLGRRHPG
jgi:hypothetical protein